MKREKLPEDFKAKWVAALRSGEYEQRDSYLYSNNGYCCLGVACVVLGADPDDIKMEELIDENLGRRSKHIYDAAPSILKGSASHLNPDSHNPIVEKLTSMNDQGASFSEIADYIEQNL